MKLSGKIFLGICIPAIVVITVISSILINKSFNTNLDLQLNLYIKEFENIDKTINDTVENTKDEYMDVIKYISDYYKEKNIYLAYYSNNQLLYGSNKSIKLKNKDLLKVTKNKYNVVIEKHNNRYYSFISTGITDYESIVYIRDINKVYEERNNLIGLCIIVVGFVIIIITFIAYIISKTLTKPLKDVSKEMSKLSSGNYNISLKEGKDEIGILSKEFNNMSKELERRNKELLELIDSKQLFIDNLSHEMNTPLTSILGYSTLLESARLDDEQKMKYLHYIQDETKRINEMYKKLLVISYKENNNIDKVMINIDNLINEVLEELNSKINSNNIKVIIDNNVDYITGDRVLISLALSNLIRNAINASDINTTITIRTYINNNKKYISVIDEGKGIEKEDINKIIEPFYRVDKARSRSNGGTGLGLSIVTRVMELHKGKLNIESKVGIGSTFILEFNE